MWDDGPGAVTVSSYIHGYDETAITDEQLAAIKAEWTAQRPLNLSYWAAETPTWSPPGRTATSGSPTPGRAPTPRCWRGRRRWPMRIPKEGRNSWVGVYGIRAGTQNYDLALKFLDEKLADATATTSSTLSTTARPTATSWPRITDETLKEAFSIDDPDILETTNFTPNLTAEQRDAWTEMWAEVKAAQ